MSNQPTYIYLHGFASGPQSEKAVFFAGRLKAQGLRVLMPDLNGRGFEHLTLTGQLEIIENALTESGHDLPVVMFGSSMGGLLATIAAQKHPSIKGLVLMAPGFDLPRRWKTLLGDEGLTQWRANGYTEVFHYGLNKQARLNYSFIEDAEMHQTSCLRIKIPALVFHGVKDETVPYSESIDFKQNNLDLVELNLLDSDHGLLDRLDEMWEKTWTFLEMHRNLSGWSKVGEQVNNRA